MPDIATTKYVSQYAITHTQETAMRTTIEIDDAPMDEARKAAGHTTKKQTVDQALRLMVRLRGQQQVGEAFGKYRWRGNLARPAKGEKRGDSCRRERPEL
jgi:Arc/MetJ family transcription regulator